MINKKPWLQSSSGMHKTMYPLSWNKKNGYALFSPGIDRFFLIDSYDPWIMLETSRVLSSKVSNIVYVLDKETLSIDNLNCLFYTTKHKMNEKFYGGPTVMSHRQSSMILKIQSNMLKKTEWPIDFLEPTRKAALLKLKEYSQFSLRIVHAITCAVNLRNSFPEKYYLDTYFSKCSPDEFTARADTSDFNDGMDVLIKNILYDSPSIEIALDQIHDAWRKYTYHDVLGIRQTFYQYSGIEQPQDLKDLGSPGEFDKIRSPQTMWVV